MMAIVNRTRDSFYDQGATYDDGPAQERGATASSRRARRSSTSAASRRGPASRSTPPRRSAARSRSSPWVREQPSRTWSSASTPGAPRSRATCARPAPTCSTTPGAGTTRLVEVAAEFDAAIICTHTGGLPPRTDPLRIEYDDVVAAGDRETTAPRRASRGGRRGARVDRHRPGPRLRQEHLPLAGGDPAPRRDGRHGLAGARLPVQQGLRRRDARRADAAAPHGDAGRDVGVRRSPEPGSTGSTRCRDPGDGRHGVVDRRAASAAAAIRGLQ